MNAATNLVLVGGDVNLIIVITVPNMESINLSGAVYHNKLLIRDHEQSNRAKAKIQQSSNGHAEREIRAVIDQDRALILHREALHDVRLAATV